MGSLYACKTCWFGQDIAFVARNQSYPQGADKWTPVYVNGKYAFKSYDGKYLQRCNDCDKRYDRDWAFVLSSGATPPSTAQFDIEYIYIPPGAYTLYSNTYTNRLTICYSCAPAKQSWQAIMYQSNYDNVWDNVWYVQYVGDKIALKGANGKYLNRCTECYNEAIYRDAAFVFENQPKGSALWSLEFLNLPGGGKWALKGDNGYYLATCYDCVTGSENINTVFVQARDTSHPRAHWIFTPRT